MIARRGGPPGSRRLAVAGRALALALGVLAWSDPAFGDPATAEALFRDGRRLLDEGRYDEACSKLAESQAQDPASGTLINLALCYEKQGKLATAWAHYRSAAVLARKDGRTDRLSTAEQKTAELESRVPRLILHAPHRRPNMEAQWSGVRVGAAAFDTPIPVDPGTHVVTVSAPGFRDYSQSISVAEKESQTLEIPELESLPTPPVAEPSPKVAAPPAAPREPAPAGTRPENDASRLPGYIVGGAGLLSLGLGTYFGLSSLDAYDEAERACPTHKACSENVRNTREEAQTKAWVANISLAAGVVATGVGAWLVFGSSEEKPTTVFLHVAPTSSGAELRVRASL